MKRCLIFLLFLLLPLSLRATAGCGAFTDNSLCGFYGGSDPYEGGSLPTHTSISACDTNLTMNGTYYLLTGDVSAGTGNRCLGWNGNSGGLTLDLGGHTVTGMIGQDWGGTSTGITVLNGVVDCNAGDSCVGLVHTAVSGAQTRVHHITTHQANESSGSIFLEHDDSTPYTAGGSGMGTAYRIDHVTPVPPVGTGVGNRWSGITFSGKTSVEIDNTYSACSGGTLNACQAIGMWVVNYGYAHNNYVPLATYTGSSDSARGVMCDGGAGVLGTCDVTNNYIIANNNRAIRYRSFPTGCSGGFGPQGTTYGNVTGNEIESITLGGRLAAIHIGEADCWVMPTSINVKNNTCELGTGGNCVVSSGATGINADGNTVTCVGGSCSGSGYFFLVDILNNTTVNASSATVKNTTLPGGMGNAVGICGTAGTPTCSDTAHTQAATAVTCNTGTVAVGTGATNTVVCGAPTNQVIIVAMGNLSFAANRVGHTSNPQTSYLTNTGKDALTIKSIVTLGDFAQKNNCGTTVPASSGCAINVTFTPKSVGTRIGTLTVLDSASNSPQVVTLTGTGRT